LTASLKTVVVEADLATTLGVDALWEAPAGGQVGQSKEDDPADVATIRAPAAENRSGRLTRSPDRRAASGW